MLVKLKEDGSFNEVFGHPGVKRDTVYKLIRDSVNKGCVISFYFPEVLGEFTIHNFCLDSSSDNYGITCGSLRTYLRSFSDEILNTVKILVTF